MIDVLVLLVFVLIGVAMLFDIGGIAEMLAAHGRRQAKQRGQWKTAGTPKTALAVRLLGIPFIVIPVGISLFPPS